MDASIAGDEFIFAAEEVFFVLGEGERFDLEYTLQLGRAGSRFRL